MFDAEIDSLLEDAGYRFDPATGLYQVVTGAAEGETDHSSEFISDELGIPLDDLIRWEGQQMTPTDSGSQ
jgi:hypothetical protein